MNNKMILRLSGQELNETSKLISNLTPLQKIIFLNQLKMINMLNEAELLNEKQKYSINCELVK